MKKAKAREPQLGVPFVKCKHPVTIDRSDWGPGNFQNGPNGAFLKLNADFSVSHLVQPNADKTAPKGWERTETLQGGVPLFDKQDIWVDPRIIENETVHVLTLDGPMTYQVTHPSVLVYNMDENGEVDHSDSWIMTIENFQKNYFYID
jgi:hypothetical protein